eukprot:jgi/Botrbrau1/8327/Bobra.0081s0016.1
MGTPRCRGYPLVSVVTTSVSVLAENAVHASPSEAATVLPGDPPLAVNLVQMFPYLLNHTFEYVKTEEEEEEATNKEEEEEVEEEERGLWRWSRAESRMKFGIDDEREGEEKRGEQEEEEEEEGGGPTTEKKEDVDMKQNPIYACKG